MSMRHNPATVAKCLECYRMKRHEELVTCRKKSCPYNNNDPEHGYWCCSNSLLYDAVALLKEQEPKHAHWIEGEAALSYDGVYGDDYIVCSGCHKAFCIMDNCTEEFDYCPHCGAKMNGGEAGCLN